MSDADERQALAHYLWPPRWVGDAKINGADWPIGERMDEAMVTGQLPRDIWARAFRDGMIAFALGAGERSISDDYFGWTARCVRLMNAHLACLDAVRPEPWFLYGAAVVPPLTTLPVLFGTGRWNQGANTALDGGARFALYQAREPWCHPGERTGDWRFYRVQPISVEHMQQSFDLLGSLLERPSWSDVLLRAELLQRARTAFTGGDPSGALINAWAAIEDMLRLLLDRYLDDNEDRSARRMLRATP